MLVLNPRPDAIYIDGTLGGATHTEELLKRSAPSGRVFSFDVDLSAIERAKHTLAAYGSRWMPIEANFRHLDQELRQRNINQVDGILLDLGLSSDELADPTRGISFQQDGPLDMRLGPKANDDGLTAAEIVNTWQTKDLITLFRELGEERYALFIAKAIVSARRDEPIVTTQALVQIIKAAVPGNYEKGRIHPATRSFQALRIAVNDEIQVLKDAIKAAHSILRPDGVLAIISFHSLEDRIVKLAFKDQELWNVLTKKPIEPSPRELQENPRSRSANLRAAAKRPYA